MPTESLTKALDTSMPEPARLAWVILPGCSMRDSTPPRLSASQNNLVVAQILERGLLRLGFERDHAPVERLAGCRHLLSREVVTREGVEAGEVDGLDGRLFREPACDAVGPRGVRAHP